jgi:hypothetical protein
MAAIGRKVGKKGFDHSSLDVRLSYTAEIAARSQLSVCRTLLEESKDADVRRGALVIIGIKAWRDYLPDLEALKKAGNPDLDTTLDWALQRLKKGTPTNLPEMTDRYGFALQNCRPKPGTDRPNHATAADGEDAAAE